MEITIKKGNHLSNQLSLPRFCLFSNGQIVTKVKFTKSCRYDVGKEQKDWHKLMGASWGFFPLILSYMMHEDSSRFGWRYNPKTDKIELSPYFYTKGKRHYAETLNIEPAILNLEEEYEVIITPFLKKVIYTVNNSEGRCIFRYVADQHVTTCYGWLAPVYFGGTPTAPHDIHINITRL